MLNNIGGVKMFKCKKSYNPQKSSFCDKIFEEDSNVVCDSCGKPILSTKPVRCPFCGKNFGNRYYPEWKQCPTCGFPVSGYMCILCGEDEL
jgi:predicted amidophosphoribosyltransferase